MKITGCNYGKAGCRVLKILKEKNFHRVLELNTKVLLHGKAFSVAYETDNNAPIVPTDTVKNIVFAKAKDWTFYSPEEFAINLVKFFINEYEHVEGVSVFIKQTPWTRIDGHLKEKHSFTRGAYQYKFCKVFGERNKLDNLDISSGFKGLELMKTTNSGFEKYWTDKYTVLQPSNDRVLRSKVYGVWTYRRLPHTSERYNEIFDEILKKTFNIFAEKYSPSVQNTLFLIGEDALKDIPELDTLSMEWPNIHCIPIPSPVETKNPDSVLMVTSDPHGYIVGTVTRNGQVSSKY